MSKFSIITTPRFEKDIQRLSKKFRKIDKDLDNILNQLEMGELLGDVIERTSNDEQVYKCRVPNTSDKRGKSGGFRIIYYAVTKDNEIYLLTIYSKTEVEDIDASIIAKYIKEIN